MAIKNVTSGILKHVIAEATAPRSETGASLFSELLTNRFQTQNLTELSANPPASPASKKALQWVILGMLTENKSTVLDLLSDHPALGKNFSRILNSAQNRHMPSSSTPLGSAVYLNQKTDEILIHAPKPGRIEPESVGGETMQPDPLSENLAASAKPYLGSPYDRLDCYELVIRTLEDMGLRYQGAGGLKEHLIQTAVQKGLPENAYLTGEGLMAVAGQRVYSKEFAPIQNPEKQTDRVMADMEPLLNEGYILAFSTPTRGHTGIVSAYQDQWTLINSGHMDHNLKGPNRTQAVGEENLSAEIQNWFQKAAGRNEPLQITLGRLDGMQLVAFSQETRRLREAI